MHMPTARRFRWPVAALLLAAAALSPGCSERASTPSSRGAHEPSTAATPDAQPPPSGHAPFALKDDDPATPQSGRHVYERLGCIGCHTIDSTTPVGPSFKGFLGSTVTLVDGTSVTMDEARFREGIKHDPAHALRGFRPVGPNFTGNITPHEIDALIEYVKTIQ